MSAPTPVGVIAHYNLLERLEPAGPGDLYRARDTRLGRTVAVRLLPADFTADRTAFIDQASRLSALSHPNVTTLFQVGEHEGRVYLAFEFHKGQSLRAEAAGRPLNVRRAFEIAIQIADAVADAHAAGYGHGGLSPDSVVVNAKGRAKIPAFELASQSGFAAGTAGGGLVDYDSPEENRGEAPDDRSDVYSVGAVLYESLTGRRPMYRGASAPSASNPKVPQQVDGTVLKALSPIPENRYQSAAALATALREALALLDALEVPGEEEELPRASASRGNGPVVAMVVAAGAAAALAWWFLG